MKELPETGYVSRVEVAEHLNVGYQAVVQMEKRHDLRPIKLTAKCIRLDAAEVHALIKRLREERHHKK